MSFCQEIQLILYITKLYIVLVYSKYLTIPK